MQAIARKLEQYKNPWQVCCCSYHEHGIGKAS